MSGVRQVKCCSYNMVLDSSTGKSLGCLFDQTSLWLGLVTQLKTFLGGKNSVVLVAILFQRSAYV